MFTGSDFTVSAISTWRTCLLLAMTATLTGACDTAQLLAPTRSTITISAPTQILANGGTAEITAYVLEEAGTPVHNGTTVRFSTTLGTIDPENAQTRNGLARAMFSAGGSSGIAEIRATSGSASGGTDNVNMVRITVGAAAINTITLRANPGSVGPSGGAVELIASVVSEGGQGVEGVDGDVHRRPGNAQRLDGHHQRERRSAHDAHNRTGDQRHRRCRHKDERRRQGHGARGSDRVDHLRPCLGNRQLRWPAGQRGQ